MSKQMSFCSPIKNNIIFFPVEILYILTISFYLFLMVKKEGASISSNYF